METVMTTTSTIADTQEHLVSVLKDFDTALLFTRTENGQLRGRPMRLAEVRQDGTVYLCSSIGSEKMREFQNDPHVALSVQGKTKWASISGTASINRDRTLIHKLWQEAWKVWFPEGKDDPTLCLIEFRATDGEYWDNSGTRGVQFAIQAAKAYLNGERYEKHDAEQHSKVHLS
jgi:general stress protein 26